MPHPEYANCRICGRHKDECGPLSWTRLCISCGVLRSAANNLQIAVKEGPFYEHQQRRTFLAARQRLLALDPATE